MIENEDQSGMPELTETSVDPDPIRQFARWFADAEAAGLNFPNAVALATATPDGVPSARMVLLKDFDERGFTFYTNYGSQKGRELEANPCAALCFYWMELDRQVRITGRVGRTTRQESELYFHSRPADSQFGAWASEQSRVIASREVLEQRMRDLQREYAGMEVPLPPFWGGFRLVPGAIEFWQSRASRLHDRLRYTRSAAGVWIIERLSP